MDSRVIADASWIKDGRITKAILLENGNICISTIYPDSANTSETVIVGDDILPLLGFLTNSKVQEQLYNGSERPETVESILTDNGGVTALNNSSTAVRQNELARVNNYLMNVLGIVLKYSARYVDFSKASRNSPDFESSYAPEYPKHLQSVMTQIGDLKRDIKSMIAIEEQNDS